MRFGGNLSILLNTDSYKACHYQCYPAGMTKLVSYFESRGGGPTVFFGLKYILKSALAARVTMHDVNEAEDFFKQHGEPFNRDGWTRVVTKHGGRLPLRIHAVPEGSVVPERNILMRVESTDPELAWLASYVETALVRLWYPCTVATRSWRLRGVILDALRRTADAPEEEIWFKLHDFGARGVSSLESAALGGAAHLVNFKGSDTVPGVALANEHYSAGMAGFSIPAAEHSTVTTWGREGETDAYERMLKNFAKPGSLVAVVSDSYDLWNAIRWLWGERLRERVVESGATIVIRPDSGDPPAVVLQALEYLEEKFGAVENSKGFKVLKNVRVIQGDGITEESLPKIIERFIEKGYSMTNVAFGMGGGLLQQLNRDTLQFAYKACWAEVGGKAVKVNKSPVDAPEKRSRGGYLDLVRGDDGEFRTIERTPGDDSVKSAMWLMYENGEVQTSQRFDDIRARASDHERRPTDAHVG